MIMYFRMLCGVCASSIFTITGDILTGPLEITVIFRKPVMMSLDWEICKLNAAQLY